jgi:hypothetical protein
VPAAPAPPPPRLGVHAGGEALVEDTLADLRELRFRDALEAARGAGDERREADLAELELGDRRGGLVDLARPHAAVGDGVADELEHREAGDERPIDVEERADRRAGWTVEDLSRELGVRHGSRSNSAEPRR